MADLANIRFITITVEPGKDVEVNWDGFAYWEAEAALEAAADHIAIARIRAEDASGSDGDTTDE